MSNEDDKTIDFDRRCGGCGRYPKFLKRFASPRYFLVAFCLQNVIQGASTSYFVGVETSIEKHFHFTSKDFGMLIVLAEIGPIMTSLILSYLGGRGNRPRWLGIGMMISALGLLMTFTTYFIYPPPAITESGELSDSKKYCEVPESNDILGISPSGNSSKVASVEESCYDSNSFVFFVWFISYSFLGIGGIVVYAVGGPYLDDSIKKNDSPLYFAIIIAVKIMGPFFGFAVSSMFLKLYVMPGENHGIKSQDPRWIGAWWGGTLLFSLLNIIFGVVISFFPRDMRLKTPARLNGHKNDEFEPSTDVQYDYGTIEQSNYNNSVGKFKETDSVVEEQEKVPLVRDFSSALLRLLKNKTLVLTAITDVLAITAVLGFFIWLPKFLEHQFRINKSESALYTGLAGTSSVIIGILGGGLFIRQCQPSAKTLVVLCATCKAIYIGSLIGLMFVTCNFNDDLPGNYDRTKGVLNVNHMCAKQCECDVKEFIPICMKEENGLQQTFFSPCHAGCPKPGGEKDLSRQNEDFFNCSCSSTSSTISLGYCRKTCSKFTLYNLVNVIIKSFISVGAIGNLLLNLRCVDPKDKAIALGLKGTMIALGLLVAPLLFGALADSSCILWEEACGTKGSCWVYDTQDFGYKLHGGCIFLFFLSFLCDIVLSRNVSHVNLMDTVSSSNPKATRTASDDTTTSISSLNSSIEGGPVRNGSRINPSFSSLRRAILKPHTNDYDVTKKQDLNNIYDVTKKPESSNNVTPILVSDSLSSVESNR